MADELEANVELTYELIRDDGVRFTRQGWRMYQHIFNRTLRSYLGGVHPRPPWHDEGFRRTMLAATRRIRERVLGEVGPHPVDQPTFKRIAIAVMRDEGEAFMAVQARADRRAEGGLATLGPVCTDYLAYPDDPPPE